MIEDVQPDGDARRYFGLFPAIVTSIVDREQPGRIEVKFPFLGKAGEAVRAWATLLTPYADDGQGFQVLPAVDSQVVVGFEAGRLERPYIVGSAWNGKEALPSTPDEANNLRLIKTRSGSLLQFDDTAGAAKVTLTTKQGYQLVLDEGGSTVALKHQNGCVITLDGGGAITITAKSSISINAPSGLTVDAPAATFTGSVTCKPLTATSVSSPIYGQGAGNFW
jgi:uncharacterized protein involved in type VI secretion and phage assembly